MSSERVPLSLKGLDPEAAEDHRLRRDGDRDLAFRGWVVGRAGFGFDFNTPINAPVVSIYATDSGRIVLHVESTERRIADARDTPEEALEWLRLDGRGKLGRYSRAAWESACAAWPALAGHETERV